MFLFPFFFLPFKLADEWKKGYIFAYHFEDVHLLSTFHILDHMVEQLPYFLVKETTETLEALKELACWGAWVA